MKYLLFCFVVSVVLTALLIRLAHRFRWSVAPRPDRWSRHAVAKFGGVPILLTLLAGALCIPMGQKLTAIVGLTVLMGLLGFVDDVFQLSPMYKLAGQVLLCVAAVGMGVNYPLTPSVYLNAWFTIAWLVGITNAFNIIDNMDGLAAGIAVIAVAKLIFLPGLGAAMSSPMLAMAGALLGFLVFNFHPAKVFMGDTGSLGVGFFLGCSSVLLTDHLSSMVSVLVIPSLVLFLPVFDATLVSATRRLNGRAVAAGAKDHTSHRLVLLGMSERQAVLLLYLISASAGGVAAVWKYAWPDLGAGIVALYLVIATLLWLYLAKIEMPHTWLSQQSAVTLAVPAFLRRIARHVAVLALDSAMLMLSMYFAFLFRFDGLTRQLVAVLLFAAALSIVIRLPLLSLFSGSRPDWRVHSRRDVYPILAAALGGAVILAVISHYLPASKQIPSALVGVDAVFSTVLLLLGRFSQTVMDDLLSQGAGDFHSVMTDVGREFFQHYTDWKRRNGDMIALGSQNGVASDFLFGIPIAGTADLSRLIARRTITTVYLLPDCPHTSERQIVSICGAHGIPVEALHYSFETIIGQGTSSTQLENAIPQTAASD